MTGKFCAVALVALCSQAFGQGGWIARLDFNMANARMSPSPEEDKGFRVAGGAALMKSIPVNDLLQIQVGGGLDGKGVKLSGTEDGVDVETEVKFTYLEAPIMASFGMPLVTGKTGAPLRLFLNAGVEPAFLLSATRNTTAKGEYMGEDVDESDSKDISDMIKGFDLALCGEAGIEYPFSPSLSGIVGVGYSHGLLNFNDDSNDDDYGGGGYGGGKRETDRNYVIRIFVGARFGGGGGR